MLCCSLMVEATNPPKHTEKTFSGSTDHSKESSMTEIWVELHQPRLCARPPLNKSTKTRTNSQCCGYKTVETQHRTNKPTAHQGKSSKMGLVLVLKTAMIAGRFAACGSPEGTNESETSHSNVNSDRDKQKKRATFKKHSEPLASGIPGYRLNLSTNTGEHTGERG